MIQPLKINKKVDNDAKLAQIIKENIPASEFMSADEVNSMVGKINEMVPAINVSNGGFQGVLEINEKRVDSGFYIPTESGTFINAGNVVVDLSQGINFVTYDGDKWAVAMVPIVADGKVEEGNNGFVSGGEVYKSIPIIETNDLLDENYIKRNYAVKTDGEVFHIGYNGGCYSIVDQPLGKGKEFKLLLKYTSNDKYFFLVNDKGEVDKRTNLNKTENVFKTTDDFYKLRAYVKMLDTQEPEKDWLEYMKLFIISDEKEFVHSLNGVEVAAKGIGVIEETNNFAVSGATVALEAMLNSKLEFITDFEKTNYNQYIAKDTALGSGGLVISSNAQGYDIVKYMPIPTGITKANISGVIGVEPNRTKIISEYDVNLKPIKNVNQKNGDNIITFDSYSRFISFTLKTPTEESHNVSLYFDSKLSGIKAYNKIPFTLDQRKVIYKRGISLGDSITWYDGKPFNSSNNSVGEIAKGYQSYVRDYFGCEYLNAGKSGQDITQIISTVKSYDYKDFDFATLTSMANDARKDIPIGELKDVGSVFDITTYYGALQESVEFILKSNPEITLILLTGVKGWFNENGTSDVPSLDNKDIPIKYVEAIKKIASLYSLPVVDWYNESGINKINRPFYIGDKEELPYYLHPNNKGYKKMASLLISKMLNVRNEEKSPPTTK
ncbi:SGNH/GDSL hydrolase family protein [Myroides marinus]|uniref:SGNH/GDSL hydrolase family protein n=1 Tax=Myroides marinus TaxID=703342 RepID=UPI0025761725|nr:SGNH/GDSL hydrolase family protein [Myroides marinus]MDM1366356.1 SGNH/GDSL hydrolase family protein [Myroides marinus]